jgi:hypothetical protein
MDNLFGRTMPFKTLEYLPGASAGDCRRLRAIGVTNTNFLLHAATLGIDRERLSKKTGISPERLLELAHQSALLEISGMSRHLPVVRRLGVSSLKDLKAQDADSLHSHIVEAVGFAGSPRLSDVQYWVSQARCIDTIEEEEEAATRP